MRASLHAVLRGIVHLGFFSDAFLQSFSRPPCAEPRVLHGSVHRGGAIHADLRSVLHPLHTEPRVLHGIVHRGGRAKNGSRAVSAGKLRTFRLMGEVEEMWQNVFLCAGSLFQPSWHSLARARERDSLAIYGIFARSPGGHFGLFWHPHPCCRTAPKYAVEVGIDVITLRPFGNFP